MVYQRKNAILDSEKKKIVKAPGFEEILKAMVKAQKIYASLGITTTQDASVEEANGYNHILGACAQNNNVNNRMQQDLLLNHQLKT